MTPDEVNEIRQQREKEIEDSLYTEEVKKDAEKYRYAIRNQPGTILTKDGLIYNGVISFNPDLYPPGPVAMTQGKTIYNNCDPNLVGKQLFKANPDFANRMQELLYPKILVKLYKKSVKILLSLSKK